MKRLAIGVLELLSDSISETWGRRVYGRTFRRHYASIMPQVVSVWCRQLGHRVTYSTYYGQADPRSLLPEQLDVVFVSTYTQASAAAYALARTFRRDRTLTVIGGPHARSFPTDCLRFFDLVVRHCDQALLSDILRGTYAPGTLVSSSGPPTDLPSVEERLPEIVRASLTEGRRPRAANVPLLSSLGCPYACDFCIDWNSPYASLSTERLRLDLEFVGRHLPGVYVSYHDPNFAVNFDAIMSAIESLPVRSRNPYFAESSLSLLKRSRLQRLKATNCFFLAPGVESWGNYSSKAGVGHQVGDEKLERVVEHFQSILEYVPNLQANFIFGTDADSGHAPVELTEEFMRRVPQVWPVLNIPTPFGGTPLYDTQLSEGRILRSMPFSFYYMPYLVMTLKNYSPMEYYDSLIRLHASAYAWKTIGSRIPAASSGNMRVLNLMRTFGGQGMLRRLRSLRARLADDAVFRRFHEGTYPGLPSFYRQQYVARLGGYASLLSDRDMTPEVEGTSTARVH